MFLIMTGICALGVLGALLLRSGRTPTVPAETISPAQPISAPPPANGQPDGQSGLVPSVAITSRSETPPEDG
jgi:hypothetical protein